VVVEKHGHEEGVVMGRDVAAIVDKVETYPLGEPATVPRDLGPECGNGMS
jgi:hypothetical protein